MHLPHDPCRPEPGSDFRLSRIDHELTSVCESFHEKQRRTAFVVAAWLTCGFDLVFGLSYIARPIL
jgi:hypothetical protein